MNFASPSTTTQASVLPIWNFADTFVIVWRFKKKNLDVCCLYLIFCELYSQLSSAVLSQNLPLLNFKLETAQITVTEIERDICSFISILILVCQYGHNAIVSTVSVFPCLIHVKVCEYENYKDYENKCFSLHPPQWNIIICLPPEIVYKGMEWCFSEVGQ